MGKEVKINVYGSKNPIKVILSPFPQKYIIEGVKCSNKHKRKFNKQNKIFGQPSLRLDKVEDFKGLKLCNHKDKWWIYYDDLKNKNEDTPYGVTGHFISKKLAIEWFTGGGR